MKYSKEIIAKVYAQYLGAKVDLSNTEWYKLEAETRNRFIEAILVGVNMNEESVGGCIKHNITTQNNGLQFLDFSAFKLVLKPLSALTKEDAIILNDMKCGNSEFSINFVEGENFEHETILDWTSINFNQYQYLISQFYDIPHRLLKVGGRTHADLKDGKTLFEAGLAIYETKNSITDYKLVKIGDNYWLKHGIFFIACSDKEIVSSDDNIKFELNISQIETLLGDNTNDDKKEWYVEIETEFESVNHASGLEPTSHPIMDVSILQNRKPKITNGYINIIKIK